MPHQDFGPVRLTLPSIDAAIQWNKAIRARLAFGENLHPVDQHEARALLAAEAIAALSAETDADGKPQSWGDHVRNILPGMGKNLDADASMALKGLRALGAGYQEVIDLAVDVEKWLSENIVKPVEAGEGRASFFARKQAP